MPVRAVAFVLLCLSFASAQPILPATPAGRVLTAWLSAFNSGDLAALQAFDATHRPTVGTVMTDYPNADAGGTGDFMGPEFMKNRLTVRTHADYVAMFGGRAPLLVTFTVRSLAITSDSARA
jgi:hypothetical protein